MLIVTPANASRSVNAAAVYCTPWPVLYISGVPRPPSLYHICPQSAEIFGSNIIH
jgi:hypothetical protein